MTLFRKYNAILQETDPVKIKELLATGYVEVTKEEILEESKALAQKGKKEESEKPLSQLNKDEIKVKLDGFEVAYSNETKDELYELLKQTIESHEKGEGGEA